MKSIVTWYKYNYPFVLAIIVCAIFIGYTFMTERLADFYAGDEFLIFYYAELYDHADAIVRFFGDHARIIEGVFWTYLYKVLGYAPAEMQLVSLALHFIGVFLATLSLRRIWPQSPLRPSNNFLMMLLFFFNHKLLVWTFRSSGDNSRITVIFFFLSVLFAQQWASSRFRLSWLLLALGSFLASLFTYESALLLFPVTMFLAWPMIPDFAIAMEKKTIIRMSLISLLGSSLIFIPVGLYRLLSIYWGFEYVSTTHPLRGITFARLISRFLDAIHLTLRYFSFSGEYDYSISHFEEKLINILVVVVVLCSFILVIALFARIRKGIAVYSNEMRAFTISLAALWMLFGGLLVFGIYGLGETEVRAWTIAIYSVSIMLLLLIDWSPLIIIRYFWIAIAIFFVIGGYNAFFQFSDFYLGTEEYSSQHELSLVNLIPAVKPGTTFIQIDDTSHGVGCAPSKMMLYGVEVICGFLTHDTLGADYKTRGERNEGRIYFHRGEFTVADENWIILGKRSDGAVYIIAELSPKDNLLLEWKDESPILTDYNRIIPWETPSSPMYLHLLERRNILDMQRDTEGLP